MKVDLVSDEIMTSLLSDTVTSQGIVASFSKPEIDFNHFETGKDIAPLILISDKLSDPGTYTNE